MKPFPCLVLSMCLCLAMLAPAFAAEPPATIAQDQTPAVTDKSAGVVSETDVPVERLERALRRATRRAWLTGKITAAQRDAIVAVLEENPTLDVDGEVTTYLHELRGDIVAFMQDEAQATGEKVRLDFLGFFQFIIDNWDSIYAIIQTFIDMFSSTTPIHPGYCHVEVTWPAGLAA